MSQRRSSWGPLLATQPVRRVRRVSATRRVIAALAALAPALLLLPAAVAADSPGTGPDRKPGLNGPTVQVPTVDYAITTQTGQSIVPGTTDIGFHCDDCVTTIALPFPIYVYGVQYTSANLSSNGNIQFDTSDPGYANEACLPAATYGRAFFPYWDDMSTANSGYGIFTTVTGSAPNRTFYIEWRAQYFGGSGTANFEFAYNENNRVLKTIYGTVSHGSTSSTEGVQDGAGGAFDQYGCNGAGGAISSGMAVTYTPTATSGITSVSPVAGPPGGGQSVVINGFNFSGVHWVSFGGVTAPSFTVNSPTKITAVSPAHAAGTVHVRVNTSLGTSAATNADFYTFETAPTVTSVSPVAGPPGGGQSVTIYGTNFMGTNWVTFGGVAAASFTVNSPIKITAVSPAHAGGVVHVRVNTPLGTSAATNADKYAFEGTPTITSVSPVAGPIGGGQTVVINGTNLFGAGWVTFGGTATSFTINSPTKITATTPAHAAGTVHVRVNTPLGTSATTSADLYVFGSQPTISSVSPYVGPTAGGQSVIITGTDFLRTNWVSFGGTAASFTVNSATQITAVSPAHAAGAVHVRVNTPIGTSATTSADLYTFGVRHYTITTQTGQSIVPGVTDIGNHGDDTVTTIALPFPIYVYGVQYTTANVGANGNIQFDTTDTTFTNACLPWASHGHAFFPYWDDLYLVNPGYGIFTTVTGSAPNRTFYIEWRAQYFPGSGTANFEFAYNENDQILKTIYGTVTNGNTSSTEGIQDATNSIFDQYGCNGAGGAISSGLSVTYTP